jgi:hypothetical protein
MALFVRRRWPKVAAAVAVVLAVVLVVFLLTRDSSPSGPSGARDPVFGDVVTPGETPAETTAPPVALPAVLTASDAELRTFTDQRVAATSANVLRPVGPSAAWVGDDDADRVLLVLVATEHPFEFKAGDHVTFDGVVQRGTPEFGTSLGLTGADAAEFAKQGAYVEVTTYAVG